MVSDWLLSESSADSFVCLFARESRLLHRAVFRGQSGGDVATLDKEIPGLVTVGDEVNLVWNSNRRLGPMTVKSTEDEQVRERKLLNRVGEEMAGGELKSRCARFVDDSDNESISSALPSTSFVVTRHPWHGPCGEEVFDRFEIRSHSH